MAVSHLPCLSRFQGSAFQGIWGSEYTSSNHGHLKKGKAETQKSVHRATAEVWAPKSLIYLLGFRNILERLDTVENQHLGQCSYFNTEARPESRLAAWGYLKNLNLRGFLPVQVLAVPTGPIKKLQGL